jgi:acetamidase/formamidase
MKRLPIGPLYYEFSRHNEPRLRIEPGETLIVESEDAFSGQIRTDDDRRDRTQRPHGNPQTGPIWVEGAELGDALAVTIHEIKPLIGQCATRIPDLHTLAAWLGTDAPHGTHICPIRDGKIYWSDRLTIPYQPMLGCMGTAPDTGVPTTGPAGPHGGNMDIIEVRPGSIVYLPVFVPGGYLYLGDAHAAMGHGELSAAGLEMPAESTITVNLVKGKKIPGVRIETPTEIMTIATRPRRPGRDADRRAQRERDALEDGSGGHRTRRACARLAAADAWPWRRLVRRDQRYRVGHDASGPGGCA